MKKRLLLIILACLGSLTLIALSYGKERMVKPISVTRLSKTTHSKESFQHSLPQAEKIDSEISDIATKAIELGHYNYARQQIEILEDLSLKVELLRQLVDAYLAVGQTKKAFFIVNEAVALDQQNGSFDSLTWATDWLLTGQEKKVKDIITDLEGTQEQQAQIYLSLAQSYLQAGNILKAFELAKLIPADTLFVPDDYPDPRNELLQTIIAQALQQKNWQLASQVAMSFPQKTEQVIALRKIAHQYLQEKNLAKGKEKLTQALSITKTIDAVPVIQDRHSFWSEPNAKFLLDLAQDYQELGEKQKALEILALAQESIQNFKTQFTFDVVVWNRSQALQKLASCYLDFGEKEKGIFFLNLAAVEAKRFRRKKEVLIKELLDIASSYLNIGEKERAYLIWKEAFNKLKIIDPKSAELVLKTARVAILVGETQEGIKLVETTKSFLMQLEIYTLAGEDRLTEQLAEQKLQQINQLPFDNDSIITLEQIASSLAENKKIAFKFSETIKNPLNKAYLLVAISQNYAEKNNLGVANTILDKAMATAQAIPNQKERERWFIETTNRLLETNEVDQHFREEEQLTIPLWQLQLAQKITEKSNLPNLIAKSSLKTIEKELIEVDEKTVLKSLKKQMKYLQNPSFLKENFQDYLHLFKLAIKLNKNDFALFIAQNIPHLDYKIVALRQVAQKYAIKGNKEKAKKVLSEVMKLAKTREDSNRKDELIKGLTEQEELLFD